MSNFQLYHGQNKLHCKKILMMVDMSIHLDILSWFQANHSLLFPLNAACLIEKQQKRSLIWLDRGSKPRSPALQVSTLTITPMMQFEFIRSITLIYILWSLVVMADTALLTIVINFSPSMSVGSVPGCNSSCFLKETCKTFLIHYLNKLLNKAT